MKRRALTLVELLVVIGVIALLIAFLLPALSNARKHARTVTCLSNLRTLQLSFVNYFINVNDNQSIFYKGDIFQSSQNLWLDELRRAGGVSVIRFCPEAMELAPMVMGNVIQGGTANTAWTWHPNTDSYTGSLSGTYAFNGWLYTGLWPAGYPAITLPKMWRDDVPVFCDSIWVDVSPLSTDSPPSDLSLGATEPDMDRICLDRHHMAINVAFLDGNVQTVKLQDLWTLRWNNGFTPPSPLPTVAPAQ